MPSASATAIAARAPSKVPVNLQRTHRERLLVTLALLVCLFGVAAFPDTSAVDLSSLQDSASHIGISPVRGSSSISSRASSKLRSLSSPHKRSIALIHPHLGSQHALHASGRTSLPCHRCAGSTAFFAGAGRSPPDSL